MKSPKTLTNCAIQRVRKAGWAKTAFSPWRSGGMAVRYHAGQGRRLPAWSWVGRPRPHAHRAGWGWGMRGTLLWAAALVVGCGAGMGGGTIVAGTGADTGIHRTTWSFVRGSDAARLSHVDYPAGTGPLTLLPQAQGFLGLDPGTSPLLHRIDGSGADVGSTATSARSIVLDPSGGVAG